MDLQPLKLQVWGRLQSCPTVIGGLGGLPHQERADEGMSDPWGLHPM